MRNVTVAATQMACTWDREETLERAAGLVEEAAQKGANIVLLQELFETPYFLSAGAYGISEACNHSGRKSGDCIFSEDGKAEGACYTGELL